MGIPIFLLMASLLSYFILTTNQIDITNLEYNKNIESVIEKTSHIEDQINKKGNVSLYSDYIISKNSNKNLNVLNVIHEVLNKKTMTNDTLFDNVDSLCNYVIINSNLITLQECVTALNDEYSYLKIDGNGNINIEVDTNTLNKSNNMISDLHSVDFYVDSGTNTIVNTNFENISEDSNPFEANVNTAFLDDLIDSGVDIKDAENIINNNIKEEFQNVVVNSSSSSVSSSGSSSSVSVVSTNPLYQESYDQESVDLVTNVDSDGNLLLIKDIIDQNLLELFNNTTRTNNGYSYNIFSSHKDNKDKRNR